jgi:hypothetical protein
LTIIKNTGSEPTLDKLNNPFITDSMTQELLQPSMVEASKKIADINLERVVQLVFEKTVVDRGKRIMSSSSRSKSK